MNIDAHVPFEHFGMYNFSQAKSLIAAGLHLNYDDIAPELWLCSSLMCNFRPHVASYMDIGL